MSKVGYLRIHHGSQNQSILSWHGRVGSESADAEMSFTDFHDWPFFKRKSLKLAESDESTLSQPIPSLGLLQEEFWGIIIVIEWKLKGFNL
jgi:hypothetical protein